MKQSKIVRAKSNPVAVGNTRKSDKSASGKRNGIYLTLLFFYAFLIYGQSIKFDFVMDDTIIIKLNKSVQKGTAGLGELFTKSMVFGSNGKNDGAYRPVTMMSFALDKQLFGDNPAPYHFINIFLYALTGIYLFLLLKGFFPGWHAIYPFFISLLFMAHPIHTEVVANIKSRDEILCFLFTLLSMLVSIKMKRENMFLTMVTSFFLFLMACLSKETALTFIIIVPMSFYFFTEKKVNEIIKISIPFFAGAACYMILRTAFLSSIGSGSQIPVINNTLMAASNAAGKYATIIYITWRYLWLLIFPHPLTWDYSYKEIPICNFSELRTIIPLILFMGLTAWSFISFPKKSIFSWCILFFFLSLALVSNILIPIAATMAERFLYIPALGFCMAVVAGMLKIFRADVKNFSIKKHAPMLAVFIILTLMYSCRSYVRTGEWKSNITLFESGIQTSPNSTRTHSSLAYEYGVQAEKSKNAQEQHALYIKSIDEFKKAVAIYEGNKDCWYALAHTCDILGNYEEAEKYYKKAIEIDPGAANSYNNLGAIYLRRKNYSPAIELFYKAIALDKKYADPYGNLGAAYHFQNNYAEAIRYYEQALAINPNLQTVINNIAKARKSLEEGNIAKQ